MQRFVRFGLVGTIGFLVDAGLVVALTQFAGLPSIPARIASFLTAATVTFVLNWNFTFERQGRPAIKGLASYWLTTGIGAMINLFLFGVWISNTNSQSSNLVIGTAIGSLVAMSFNFVASSRFVFSTAQRRE